MERQRIIDGVMKVLAEQFDRDVTTFDLETPISEFHADSLEAVELVLELEDEFEIPLPDKEVEAVFPKQLNVIDDDSKPESWATIKDLVDLVEKCAKLAPDPTKTPA